MDINKKILYGFIVLGAIGLAIFLMQKFELDYGIRPQDFQLKEIKKIVVRKYPEEYTITLTDSVEIKPIVSEILKAKETKISNTKSGPFLYDIKLYYRNNDSTFIGSIHSPTEGKWLRLYSTNYRRDSLFTILDSLMF